MWPSRTRSVAIASADSTRERLERDLVGRLAARCGSGRTTQSDSNPSASACVGELDRARPGVGRAPSRRTRPSSPAAPSARPASRPPVIAGARPASSPFGHGGPSRTSPPRTMSRRAGRRSGPRGAAYPRASAQEPTMTDRSDLRPDRPLPGPPDPWDGAPTPSLRSGPPFHMTDMIAAEPALAGRILDRLAGCRRRRGRARRAPSARRSRRASPVVVTGCGTSEHGALAVADDPPRGGARRRPARTRRSARSRPSSCRSIRRPAVSSSASRTRAGRPPRTRRSRRPAAAGAHDRRHHRQPPLAGRRAGRRSWSRPASSTRAGATRSAT